MKREIKFRAWDKENNLMVYDFNNDVPEIYGLRLGESIHQLVYTIGLGYDSLMQYTGLKDKNGKEIYEGDIVKSSHWVNPCEVVWCNNYSHFTISSGSKNPFGFPPIFGENTIEVIGNIYETPELLK